MVAPMVVMLDEGADLGLKVSRAGSSFPAGCGSLRVWCQRLILPWVWGGIGAPRVNRRRIRPPIGVKEAFWKPISPKRGASFHA